MNLMNQVNALSLRDLRTFCGLYTRDPAMAFWSRSQCVAYIQAWEAIK
jgi:hypothetical protein